MVINLFDVVSPERLVLLIPMHAIRLAQVLVHLGSAVKSGDHSKLAGIRGEVQDWTARLQGHTP